MYIHGFFADINKKNRKSDTIFGNLGAVTQEGEKETRKVTPLFSSTF